MAHEFEVHLEGPRAKLGEVPAADVAKLLVGIERVLAHGTAHVLNRPIRSRGRREQVVADASRVALVALKEGSVVPVFAIPEAPAPSGFGLNTTPLGELGLREALRAAADASMAPAEIAGAFAQLGRELSIGVDYDAIAFLYVNGGPEQSIRLDAPAMERLQLRAETGPRLTAGGVQGVLVEADFEALRAHVRTREGRRVLLDYGADLADDVEDALRKRGDFVGEVVYDSTGDTVESVHLSAIEHQPAIWPGLESGEFWQNRTVDELRQYQHVTASPDVSTLGMEVSDEEADAFLEALGI